MKPIIINRVTEAATLIYPSLLTRDMPPLLSLAERWASQSATSINAFQIHIFPAILIEFCFRDCKLLTHIQDYKIG